MNLMELLTKVGFTSVAIVDDDFDYPSLADLPDDFLEVVRDVSDPDFARLATYAVRAGLLSGPDAATPQRATAFLQGARFVSHLLQEAADAEAIAVRNQYLAPTLESRVTRLKPLQQIVEHLQQLGYAAASIQSRGRTTTAADLFGASLVFIDLMLDTNRTEDAAIALIKELIDQVQQAAQPLPSIVLMSQNKEGLGRIADKIRRDVKLPASAFRFLPKEDLTQPYTRVRLHLLLLQLVAQRSMTAALIAFVHSWSTALKESTADFESGLWNLDARSVHGLMAAAAEDGANPDDHIVEFLMRGLLWSIEGKPQAKTSLQVLVKAVSTLQGEMADAAFMPDPYDRGRAIRGLMHSYRWHAPQWTAAIEKPGLAHDCDWARQQLGFGDVFVSANTSRRYRPAWIHLTQPCDLARCVPGNSNPLLWIPGVLRPDESAKGTHTRHLQTDSNWFRIDWNPSKGRTFMPSEIAVVLHDNSKYRRVGRVRLDIAMGLLEGYSAGLTRVAYARPTWMAPVEVEIYKKDAGGAFQATLQNGEPVRYSGTLTFTDESGTGKPMLTVAEWQVADMAYQIAGENSLELAQKILSGIVRGGNDVGGKKFVVAQCDVNADKVEVVKQKASKNDPVVLVLTDAHHPDL